MTNKTERTPQDAEAVAFLAVEQHCIVSPHLRGPDSKDFRRQLIAKYREAVERRVRAECAAKVDDPEPCDWHQDGMGLWQTDCGNAFEFNEDGPWMNGLSSIWEMSTMSGSKEGNPWHKMLEDYYTNGTPIPFYRPYIPLQWVDLKELEKQDDAGRCVECPAPPQAAPEPRIAKPSAQVSVGQKMVQRWDSDGFGRTWYRVVQKDFPNRDYGDFRAVLHAMMSNPPMPSAEEYAALLRLAQEAK